MVAEHPDVAARLDATSTRAGKSSIPRNGCRTATPACAWIRAAPAARPASSIHSRRARRRDFYQCIEWAGVQPWSSGKVGLNGISYYGINQWQVASLQPPHLAAMCIWEGCRRLVPRHDAPRRHLSTFWANWYDMQVKTVQYGLGERGPRSRVTGELVCGDETLSRRGSSAQNRADFGDDDPRAPARRRLPPRALAASGTRSPCRCCRRRTGAARACIRAATSKASCAPRRTENGWKRTASSTGRISTPTTGVELQKRFFDHFLKGEDNGWDQQPKVQLQVRHVDRFVERHENEWPLARTQWTKFPSRSRRPQPR